MHILPKQDKLSEMQVFKAQPFTPKLLEKSEVKVEPINKVTTGRAKILFEEKANKIKLAGVDKISNNVSAMAGVSAIKHRRARSTLETNEKS